MSDEFDDIFGSDPDPKPKAVLIGNPAPTLTEAAMAIARDHPEQVILRDTKQNEIEVPIHVIESIEFHSVSLVQEGGTGSIEKLPEPVGSEVPDVYAQRGEYIRTGKGDPAILPIKGQKTKIDKSDPEWWKANRPKPFEYDPDELAKKFKLKDEYHIEEDWYYGKILIVSRIIKGPNGGITFTIKNSLPNKWAPEKVCLGWPPVADLVHRNKFIKRKKTDPAPEKPKRGKKLHG